jgi:hypothetical protein
MTRLQRAILFFKQILLIEVIGNHIGAKEAGMTDDLKPQRVGFRNQCA